MMRYFISWFSVAMASTENLVVANGQTLCSRKSCDRSKLLTKSSKVFDEYSSLPDKLRLVA